MYLRNYKCFETCICEQLKELYTLLNENYVEDDDNMFRFDYAPEFLLWYVCVRRTVTNNACEFVQYVLWDYKVFAIIVNNR